MTSFDFKTDPIKNFEFLYSDAILSKVKDPNAMSLATVDKDMQPSVRVVLYKGLIRGGFSFYTNYQGKKGKDIEFNPKVGANFFWPEREQQIRIEGSVEKLSRAESEKYFAVRPRDSQLGAWTSEQSEVIPDFNYLNKKLVSYEEKYKGVDVPCPPNWGGYILIPKSIEFWFGKKGRMHERYVYSMNAGQWMRFLKSP